MNLNFLQKLMAYKMLTKICSLAKFGIDWNWKQIYFDLTCTNNARPMSEHASS